ncbi:MAG: T1SS secreted agglutinin RTX, partial [uncultured Campylobacterales bacterium]
MIDNNFKEVNMFKQVKIVLVLIYLVFSFTGCEDRYDRDKAERALAEKSGIVVTAEMNGTISVSGQAEPGSNVTVVFPDGSTQTVPADENGNYGPVTSEDVQTSGDVNISVTDISGNTGQVIIKPYTDNTAPSAPGTPTITPEANGTITVSGQAEPDSNVTVVFPDGTTTTVVADENGSYGPVTSEDVQPSGDVNVSATDAAGNTSPVTTTPYTDATDPAAPGTPTITPEANGTITVSGQAEPDS